MYGTRNLFGAGSTLRFENLRYLVERICGIAVLGASPECFVWLFGPEGGVGVGVFVLEDFD